MKANGCITGSNRIFCLWLGSRVYVYMLVLSPTTWALIGMTGRETPAGCAQRGETGATLPRSLASFSLLSLLALYKEWQQAECQTAPRDDTCHRGERC